MKLRNNIIPYFITILFSFITLTAVNGQIENEKYRTESIYLDGHFYVKNENRYLITSWGKDLKREMEVSPDAMVEYKKFQQLQKTAFILSAIGAASILSFLFVDNDDLQNGLLLGGLGLTFVSIRINQQGGKKLHKAIWLRNGEILNK